MSESTRETARVSEVSQPLIAMFKMKQSFANMMSSGKNLWQILFQLQGSIWSAVLPYCVLNCSFMVVVEVLAAYGVKIAFSPSGHGLMSLIVSFLVISKGTK